MRTTDRLLWTYGLSVLGAAGVALLRGKRDPSDVVLDGLIQGAMLGTGLTVVFWLSEDKQVVAAALPNSSEGDACSTVGHLSKKGISLLSSINPDVLYRAAKLGKAVVVGPSPDDPYVINIPNPG